MKLETAPIKEPFCLFLVGMQCRSWTSMWKVPFIGAAMTKMQKELRQDPDSGFIWGENFISFNPFTTLFLSYWKSSEHIHRFVSDGKFSHKAATKNYWQKHRSDKSLGVWHETYEIDPSKLPVENLYFGMNPFGASAFNKLQVVGPESNQYKNRLQGR